MNGFEQEIQTRIAGTDAHVVLLRTATDGIAESTPRCSSALRGASRACWASRRSPTRRRWCSARASTEGMVVKGVDLRDERGVTTVGEHIAPPLDSIPERGARGPAGHRAGLGAGRAAGRAARRHGGARRSLSGAAHSALGFAPQAAAFQVVGMFRSGLYTYDSSFGFTSIAAAQDFFELGNGVTGIEVRLADMFAAPAMARALLHRLGYAGLRANNWIDLNRNLFTWMKLEKTVMFVILALIVLVAAFNIVSTLFMVVLEKRRDIGVLKSLGATSGTGAAHLPDRRPADRRARHAAGRRRSAAALIVVLQRYPFVRLPGDVYFIERCRSRPEPGDFAAVILAALVLCLAAALYPAWQASRLDPVDAIRRQG